MLRLALPVFIQSPLSLQNLFDLAQPQTPAAAVNAVQAPLYEDPPSYSMNDMPSADVPPVSKATDLPVTAFIEAAPSAPAAPSLLKTAVLVWLAGAALIAAIVITGNVRFARMLSRNRAYDDAEFTRLLNSCRQQLNIRRRVRAVQAHGVSAAAVFGVFRQRLLISPGPFSSLTPSQKRHVLLHELTHIKRHDTAVCVAAVILTIVHWFNPLVWISLWLMRRDVEVFCDDSVVKALGESERCSYASTLLELTPLRQTPRLATALFISHSRVKKRILSIARRRKASALYSALSLMLTVTIAVTGCTVAGENTPFENSAPPALTSAPLDTASAPDALRLLSSVSYGINEKEWGGEADAVIGVLNGLTIPKAQTVSLKNLAPDRLDHDDWQAAMIYGWRSAWDAAYGEGQSAEQETLPRDTTAGSGLAAIARALCLAVRDAGLKAGLELESGKSLDDGILIIHNPLDADITIEISKPKNMVIVSVYALGGSLSSPLTSFEFDISSFTTDGNRLKNVRKAAGLLDGTLIKSGQDNGLIRDLTISAENGWLLAPSLFWPDYLDVMTAAQWTPQHADTQSHESPSVGGGLDLVLGAVYKAFSDANIPGVTPAFNEEAFGQGGDLIITSSNKSDILMRLRATDATLTVALYDASQQTLATSLNHAVCSIGLGDDITDAAMTNIRKAAQLLNGLHIAHGGQVGLMDVLGNITEEEGWLSAPSEGWTYISQMLHERSAVVDRTTQPGGGIEHVLLALLEAGALTLDQRVDVPGNPHDLNAGNAWITNDAYEPGVTVYVTVTDRTLTAQIVLSAAEPSPATATPSAAFSLDLSGRTDNARDANIQTAVELLNGATLMPGEQISLGELFSPHSSWQAAPEIIDGALANKVGSGLSMVATAVYNAAIRADLKIVERNAHAVPADYVDGGLDADFGLSGPDLKIANPYDTTVALAADYKNGLLTVTVYGPQFTYAIGFYSARTDDVQAPQTLYHYNADTTPDGTPITPGESVVWVQSRPGTTYRVYKTLTDPAGSVFGTELFSETRYKAFASEVYVNAPGPA